MNALLRVYGLSPERMRGYSGMNWMAAKAMGFEPRLKRGEIALDKSLKGEELRKTVQHELREAELMERGDCYWQAHCQAEREESG